MTLVLAARRQIGYALGRAAGGLAWLLRDEFTTDLAAGSVNGTAAEPGPGTRRTVETLGTVNIANGKIVLNGYSGSYGDPLLYYETGITRVPGRLLLVKQSNFATTAGYFGLRTTTTGLWNTSTNEAFWTVAGNRVRAHGIESNGLTVAESRVASALRSAGVFYFRLTSGVWILELVRNIGSTATLYFSASNYFVHTPSEHSEIRVPDALWLPTPLASDGFGSTFGTTDGLGHAEGIAGGIGAGGSGVAWSNVGSTWSVSGGKAINTAPSGLSQQISVLSAGTENVFAGAGLTRSAGSVGLVLSWDSASSPANGVLVYLDGTNCNIDKIVAGSTSNVRTTAVTYSAGARLVVAKNGTEYRVYYNNALVGAANTISDAGIINNTLHGIFSTDASNTLDDFTCYATGTGGQYATLDQYIQ